mgnify:CR=1 FL=1
MAKQQTPVEDPDKITKDALNIIPDDLVFQESLDETLRRFSNPNLLYEKTDELLNPSQTIQRDAPQEVEPQFDLSEEEYNALPKEEVFISDGLNYPDIKYDIEKSKPDPLISDAEIILKRKDLIKAATKNYIKSRSLNDESELSPEDNANIIFEAGKLFRQELTYDNILKKSVKKARNLSEEQGEKLKIADSTIKKYKLDTNFKLDSINTNVENIDIEYDSIINELTPINNEIKNIQKKQTDLKSNISNLYDQSKAELEALNLNLNNLDEQGRLLVSQEYATEEVHNLAAEKLNQINLAINEKAMFKGKGNPRYKEIRALFPIPSLTMHFVMSQKSGVKTFEDMSGKTILLGKGSFGAKEGAKYLKKFGLEGKVKLAEVELSNAVPALKNGQIDGFVTAGSYPAPNVIEASASMGINVISLSDKQIKISKRTKLIIPAGTYSGQKNDITTTSLPVVAYSLTDMDEEVAYNLTKSYWENKGKLGETAKWWNGVSYDMLSNITTKIHPGAIKFYKEMGAKLNKKHM